MSGNKDLAIILTARLGSERLPNKALGTVNGKPLLYWIVKRLQLAGNVILATTDLANDDKLQELGERMNVPVYRGDKDDVVSRMDNALSKFMPNAKFVMRGLGDCPFISPLLVKRATEVIYNNNAEAFAWHLPPDTAQRLVYGSREFPYSKSGWQKIVDNAKGDEREHVDLYFHRNRERFNIVYHEAPPNIYFRDYRLEVDWPEDIELIRKLADEFDIMAELDHIIRYIDINDYLPKINRTRVEITGLASSYTYDEKRQWFKLMSGVPVVAWDNTMWMPSTDRSVPIFCNGGTCLLGYADGNTLYRRNGDKIVGKARIDCKCGAGRTWNKPA